MTRLAVAIAAVALIAALGTTDIERAQQTARSRDTERAQFHRQYVFDLPDTTVTQFEVITEFRRMVMITEDHLRLGDAMFSRSVRAGEAALAPTRGLLTLKAQLRFHPLNTYAAVPPFRLAIGEPAPEALLASLDTQVTGQNSPPYKARNGKSTSTLTGAVLKADIPASRVGQTARPVGVILDGRELARTTIDFTRFD
jgi:hypothetical protein